MHHDTISQALWVLAEESDQQADIVTTLGDNIIVPVDSKHLQLETVRRIAEKNPNKFLEIIRRTPNPEIIEVVFENPTVKNLAAALDNQATLTADQYNRISEIYNQSPKKGLIKGLLRNTKHPLTANITVDDAYEFYIQNRKPSSRYTGNTAHFAVHNRRQFTQGVADRVLADGLAGLHQISPSEVGHWWRYASHEAKMNYVESCARDGRPGIYTHFTNTYWIEHAITITYWIEHAVDTTPYDELRRVVSGAVNSFIEPQARGSNFDPGSLPILADIIRHIPAKTMDRSRAVEFIIDVAADLGLAKAQNALKAIVEHADLTELYEQVGRHLSNIIDLIADSGLYTYEEIRPYQDIFSGFRMRTNKPKLGEEARRANGRAAFVNYMTCPYAGDQEKELIAEVIETEGLINLINELPIVKALTAVARRHTALTWNNVTYPISETIHNYLREELGRDLARWERLAVLANNNPEMEVENILALVE